MHKLFGYYYIMNTNKEFLSGTLRTIILALLKENGRMYGYEICQMTKELTKGEVLLTEGAIYPALHKLEKKGLIQSSKEQVNGRTRKYYAITTTEASVVEEQIAALLRFSSHLNHLLNPRGL
ncbi:MAG: PadR family transcriptional regulator [Saprospiraceae bacterium]|nr:PadR family transcriptional regulator [Saprospiraceae bacterium]